MAIDGRNSVLSRDRTVYTLHRANSLNHFDPDDVEGISRFNQVISLLQSVEEATV